MVPGKLLREISTSVSFFMSRHFNNLFEVGYFPEIWKITHVTAIYKKFGPKTCKTSYRPISPLSTMSKVFESVIHDRLSKHCTENNSISEKHAAYLKGDSTVSQLLYIVHNIRKKNNMISHGLFLDVSAAFDKVWHKGLLAKLNQIGVDGHFLGTVRSYLASRKQIVIVDGGKSESEPLEIKAGVPQGSRLGPILSITLGNKIKKVGWCMGYFN